MVKGLWKDKKMKHNGLANLFLGIIYGGILGYIHATVEAPDSLGLMIIAILFMWGLTWFFYDVMED